MPWSLKEPSASNLRYYITIHVLLVTTTDDLFQASLLRGSTLRDDPCGGQQLISVMDKHTLSTPVKACGYNPCA